MVGDSISYKKNKQIFSKEIHHMQIKPVWFHNFYK